MFAITGFYHRYFSHKAFRTSRPMQFLFALVGAASVQRGPLWWAAHHRHHHRHADTEQDMHSPRHGFFRSHMGWFLTKRGFATNLANIPDLAKFPELRYLDRFDIVVPIFLAIGLYVLGSILEAMAMGNLILTTNHAGITDICKEQNAVFCEKESVEDLARKLEELVNEQNQIQKKGLIKKK